MKISTDYRDIFSLARTAAHNTDADLGNTDKLLHDFFLKTGLAATSSFLFYIMDFVQMKYLAIDPRAEAILGFKPGYVRDGGPLAFFELFHRSDWRVQNEQIFPDQQKALLDMPAEKQMQLLFTSTYRVKNHRGRYITLGQQASYIDVTPQGVPLGIMGVVTDITPFKRDTTMLYNVALFDKETNKEPGNAIVLNKIYFPDAEQGLLSRREIEVMKWLCDGLTSKEIANKLHISTYTVNNHRASILQKTSTTNFAQVVKYAIENGFI